MRHNRATLESALAKPLPNSQEDLGLEEFFNPWDDIVQGIYGSYSSESDRLMIATLEAVRDGKSFELIDKEGFIIEFMLYVLAGHGLTEYGSSPRGSWPDQRDLWQPLIDKWKGYAAVAWGEA